MNLASSSYYYQPVTDPQDKERQDTFLREQIERLQGEFPGYGYRRLGRQLRREGMVVNDKRLRRVQRKYQLFAIRWRSFKVATTDSRHGHKVYPNLLREKAVTAIDQAWVADITYIRILRGLCLSGRHPGSLLSKDDRLGALETDRRRAVYRGPENCPGHTKTAAGLYSPLRSRGAVCLPGVYRSAPSRSDADQHVENR